MAHLPTSKGKEGLPFTAYLMDEKRIARLNNGVAVCTLMLFN